MSSEEILNAAHSYGVTVTAFLTAATIKAAIALQNRDVPKKKKQKPIKVLIPCDLRRLTRDSANTSFQRYAELFKIR